ncbi:MAG: hypothetical protein Q9174_001891 [Haloplaca sp. 1 TL-2023]
MMKIVCLHGGGANSNHVSKILKTQLAPVAYELSQTDRIEFFFIRGRVECAPSIGIAEQYDGPYFRFLDRDAPSMAQVVPLARSLSKLNLEPENFARELRTRGVASAESSEACDYLEEEIGRHPDGPFDGVLGFSEGSSVAASLMLRRAAHGKAPLFKFAIFFCAILVLRSDDKGPILADEMPLRINIPTLHITGARDPARLSAMTLYNLCDRDSATLYDHGKGHTIPWGPPTEAITKHIRKITRLSSEITHHVRPIAVIGFAGRFPGEANNTEALWDLCCESRSAWSEIPETRFSARAYLHSDPSKMGCFNSKGAHFLRQDVSHFDAAFFGIPPVEAKAMDPQQRLLLETSYEALENAGITLDSVSGSNTGVYVGASPIDYTALLYKDTQDIPMYQSTGTSANILSNRISYAFNLKGASWSMDTACSSSLAALHSACQGIKLGEIDQAIVGGVHIMLDPNTMVGMGMLRLFGGDGRSYTYDSRGSGYGRGEGVVSLIVKPLDKALLDGDTIRAVIRNTGVNQDGRTAGITFPSCDAQASLIRSVYETAGLDPTNTDYVEAHGTGTAVGDPVEAEAIARSMTRNRSPDKPLIVGSLKSNIGHLEAASGLAAMVKTIMALEKNVIPPNFDFQTPNEDIPMEKWNIKVPTSIQHWSEHQPRRASISNFGFGGTNVHVILESFTFPSTAIDTGQTSNGVAMADVSLERSLPNGYHILDPAEPVHMSDPGTKYAPQSSKRRLFVLSAKSKASLKEQRKQLGCYLERHKNIDLDALAYTLSERRSQFEWREAASVVTASELNAVLNEEKLEYSKASQTSQIGFVFSGQGAQWANMGMNLLIYPVFARTLHEADAILQSLGAKWSLLHELIKNSDSSRLTEPILSQPATTAIQIALVNLFSTWNVTPKTVIGHSSGEIAAAYAAGALSLVDCLQIAYWRGVHCESLKTSRPDRPGGMLAIGASAAKVRPMLDRLGSAHAVVACINAPSLVTTSGDERALTRLQSVAQEENLLNRRLKVDVAYHSPHMKDIATHYMESIRTIVPQSQTKVEFYSSVKGTVVDTRTLTAEYWVENMTSPVQFHDGVQSMYRDAPGPAVLIELGPHSQLEAPLKDIIKANPSWPENLRYFPSLIRNMDAVMTSMWLAAALYVRGVNVDTAAINQVDSASPPKPLSSLPGYPWNHSKRHWHESRLSANHRQKQFPRSDLLGHLVDDFNIQEPRWRNIIRLTELPWLVDHNVQGSILFPLTGYLTMALEAMAQYATLHNMSITEATSYQLREVQVSRSMILSEERPTEISFVLRSRRPSDSWLTFSTYTWTPDGGWTDHCQGLIRLTHEDGEANAVTGLQSTHIQADQYQKTMSTHRSQCKKTLDPTKIYSRFFKGGLEFGPAFRNITAAVMTVNHCIGTVVVPDTAKDIPYQEESVTSLYPRTFDACFQVTDLASEDSHLSSLDIYVPVFVKEITVKYSLQHNPGQQLHIYAQGHTPFVDNEAESHASFIVASSEDPSHVLVDVRDVVGSRLPPMSNGLCYQLDWTPYIDLLNPEQYTVAFSSPGIDPSPQQRQLEQGAFFYIRRFLNAIAPDQVDSSPSHLRKFHTMISSMYAKAQDEDLPFQTKAWLQFDAEKEERYLEDLTNMDACGRLLCAIGANLIPIFDEEIEPLAIMQHKDKLERYFQNLDIQRRGTEIAAAIVSTLAHQKPDMRILEIGGGWGTATQPILHALGSRLASYHFTDASINGFDSAKEACSSWSSKMEYLKLDIEEDPLAQAFEPSSYDLVFASTGLSHTASTSTSLRHIRALLRPGGKLLFGVPTATLCSATVIFGCLPDGPLSKTQWDCLLKESDFSGIDGSVAVMTGSPNYANVFLSTAVMEAPTVYPEPAILTCGHGEEQLVRTVREHLAVTTSELFSSANHLLQVELNDRYVVVLALDEPFWSNITEEDLKKLQALSSSARGLLWVTRGAQGANPGTNMVTGLARTIRNEIAGFRFCTLDLDQCSEDRAADNIINVFRHVFGQEDAPRFSEDMEFAEIEGVLQVPRVLNDQTKNQYIIHETVGPISEPQQLHQKDRPLTMRVGQVGLLDSIYFADDKEVQKPLGPNEVEVAISAVGMNFIDIMMSLGQIPPSRRLGQECSGVISAVGEDVRTLAVGDKVCALASGSYGNFVRISEYWAVRIPQGMSFHHAASIPVIFGTAYYALMDVARLSKGESVLIHAAAGGVGQAAIMLAKQGGADLYVTVGSADKKELIMENYNVPEDRIFSSRDTSFQRALMAMTNNRGVDIVLNSTSGDILHQSWQCLAPLGRFIEIGKRDFVQNSNLEMQKFLQSVTFAGVDLGVYAQNRPRAFQQMLSDMVELHSKQVLEPIKPLNVFPISEIQQAMRMMQNGKHIGKIIIDCSGDQIVKTLPAPYPKAVNNADASYLITGGTGGIGRSITRWLAREGAKNIILVSRRGSEQEGIAELIKELQDLEVKVHVDRCDVANLSQVEALITKYQHTMPPIRGVIHGAMALRDTMFENASHADWMLNTQPRVQGAWNLYNTLLNTRLDFFVMLASASGIIGYPGQSAYAASNTFLDSFARYRKRLGLPASTIDIGVVEDVGYVAENMEKIPEIGALAFDRVSEAELQALVKAAMTNPIEGCDFQQTITGLGSEPGIKTPGWMMDPKFAHLLHEHQASATPADQNDNRGLSTQQLLKQAGTLEMAIRIVCEALCQRLSSILKIPAEDVDVKEPVVAYGLDSLAAVELRNWITSGLQANVPLIELMNSPSIDHLSGRIVSKSRLVDRGLLSSEMDGEPQEETKIN